MKVRVVRALIASAAVSTLFVTTAFVTPVFAEPENQVETLENQKSEVEAQADSINSQLVSLLVSYKALQQDIENQQVRIGEVGQDLAVAQENEQKQYEDMKLRIKYMYEKIIFIYNFNISSIIYVITIFNYVFNFLWRK